MKLSPDLDSDGTLPDRTLALCALALFAALCLLLTGCQTPGQRIADAQKPGLATGAGATLTGPTNSAAPSRQTATRTVTFFPPRVTDQAVTPPAPSQPGLSPAAPVTRPGDTTVAESRGRVTPPARVPPAELVTEFVTPAPAQSQPHTLTETVTTEIGAHQDAGALVAAAAAASRWDWLRWVGIVAIFTGIAGLGYSLTHPLSPLAYPLVYALSAACGVVCLFASANPAWLLVFAFPLGFYAVQQLGLWRQPDEPLKPISGEPRNPSQPAPREHVKS